MTTRSARASATVLAAIALPLAWATPRATPVIAITSWMLLGCAVLTAVRYERRHREGRRG